jgi:hypothetical protein
MKTNEKTNIRAVNQRVFGSSPRGGAKSEIQSIYLGWIFCFKVAAEGEHLYYIHYLHEINIANIKKAPLQLQPVDDIVGVEEIFAKYPYCLFIRI